MKESKIEADCNKAIRNYFKRCLITKNNSAIGFPDRTVYTPQGIFLIEYKTKTGRLSTAQQFVINTLREYGIKVYVITDMLDLALIFSDFKEER